MKKLLVFCILTVGVSLYSMSSYAGCTVVPFVGLICFDPEEFTPDPLVQEKLYYTRIGDIDGDGRTDLYVTGSASRHVDDFILRQISNRNFQIIQNPTTSQRIAAENWRVTDTDIFREDANLDGYYDFVFRNVDFSISGANDMIIYTTKGSGSRPEKIVYLDDRFMDVASEIESFLFNPEQMLDMFQTVNCQTTSAFFFNPGSLYGCDVLTFACSLGSFGFVVPASTSCFIGRDNFQAETRRFVEENMSFLQQGGLQCQSCISGAVQTVQGEGAVLVAQVSRAARARAAFVLAGVLLANDATVVGVADDILIPILVIYGGFQIAIAQNTDESPGNDVGTVPISTPASPDPFQPPNDDDPDMDDPENEELVTQTRYTEFRDGRLAKNLNRKYPRPDNAEAHHIVAKNSRFGEQGRAILARNRIYVDEARNGVWLPQSANAGTRATAHRGGGLHSRQAQQEVARRLEVAESMGATSAARARFVRRELMVLREEIAAGNFPAAM